MLPPFLTIKRTLRAWSPLPPCGRRKKILEPDVLETNLPSPDVGRRVGDEGRRSINSCWKICLSSDFRPRSNQPRPGFACVASSMKVVQNCHSTLSVNGQFVSAVCHVDKTVCTVTRGAKTDRGLLVVTTVVADPSLEVVLGTQRLSSGQPIHFAILQPVFGHCSRIVFEGYFCAKDPFWMVQGNPCDREKQNHQQTEH